MSKTVKFTRMDRLMWERDRCSEDYERESRVLATLRGRVSDVRYESQRRLVEELEMQVDVAQRRINRQREYEMRQEIQDLAHQGPWS